MIPVEECGSAKNLALCKSTNNQNLAINYEAKNMIPRIKNKKYIVNSNTHIYQYDLHYKLINVFDFVCDAARNLGDVHKNTHIYQCIKGIRKTAYGFIWTGILIKNTTS